MEKKENEHEKLEEMLKKNAELINENNELLHKIHRYNIINFWTRVVWYALLIGLPFALYFYILEPYFAAFGSSYDNFIEGLNELPGLKGIDQLLNKD